jgi:hypothetical protein
VDLGRVSRQVERPEAGLARLREAEALGGVVAVPLARVLGDMCRDDDAVTVLRDAVERQRSFESLAACRLPRPPCARPTRRAGPSMPRC